MENTINKELGTNNPNKFVGRGELVTKFQDKLERIKRQGPLTLNLLEIYGEPGMGKTMLVKALSQEVDSFNGSKVVFSFEKNKEFNLTDFWQKVIYDLKAQNPNLNIGDFNKKLTKFKSNKEIDFIKEYEGMDQKTRLFRRPEWLEDYRDLVILAVKAVNELSQNTNLESTIIKPVVFFFDHIDNLPFDVVDHIEEWMINPLAQVKRCLFVWTGSGPWRWKRPEIRRRLESNELEGFNNNETKEQIIVSSRYPDLVAKFSDRIQYLTHGHPLSTSILITSLDEFISREGRLTQEDFLKQIPDLLQNLYHKFIESDILNHLKSEDVKQAIKFLSLTRVFDSTMASKILISVLPDEFKSYTQEDYGNLVLRLLKTGSVTWEKGWGITETVRNIIQKFILVSDREKFILGNESALQVYQDWLSRPVDNRGLLVVEELYHTAILNKVKPENKKYLVSLLKRRLKQFKERIKDKEALIESLHVLEMYLTKDLELDSFTSRKPELLETVHIFKKGIKRSKI